MTWDTSLTLNQNSVINAILPVSENEIYAAGTSYTSFDAGVFVSHNLGESWEYIGLLRYNIQALGYNADHELFAGCYYDGLLKTADSGMTWETVFPHRDVLSIVIDFDEMYVGCGKQSYLNGGIFYSSDNGLTWEDHTYNITNKDVKKIVLTEDQYFYSLSRFSTAYGPPFYRSADPVLTPENSLPPDLNISVYPNPASDFLNISMSPALIKSGKLKFSIYDQTGHMVKSDSTFISPDPQTLTADITNLTPGIYYLKIIIGQSKYLHKFIVL
ncbi:MAG: T9SS type A sorting domain-containing protein [Bacteroidales bacterium]